MRRIPVRTSRPYEVLVGRGVLGELERLLPDGRPCAVLTDETVARLHGSRLHGARLGRSAAHARLALVPGEESKSFAVLERVLEFLAAAGLDRRSTLVAFGGGVVGDVGGLAAALFMRGIPLVQCPTTLLAQVDSSVGGKTAVNLAAGKNLAGTFHQPSAVLADTETLSTLSDEEFRSGLGEVVKSALVGDARLLELLEREAEAVLRRDPELLAEIVERSVRVKAGIVERDEHERHERKFLNLGHTFAHGIEQAAGFGRIPHGIAVGVGLALALEASARAGLLQDAQLGRRAGALLERLGLARDLAGLRARYGIALGAEELARGMRHDKKGRAGRPAFVLVRAAGELEVDRELDPALLTELLS